MCEQEMSLWQEHEEVQLVPYRPAGQLMEQSSPWTQWTDRESLKHTDWLTLVGDIGDNKKSNLRVLYQDCLCFLKNPTGQYIVIRFFMSLSASKIQYRSGYTGHINIQTQ